jgi:type I restriction enzyme M protein
MRHLQLSLVAASRLMTSGNAHASFIWSLATQELRGPFKQSEYGRIILPFVVLRRLDQVLAATKSDVLEQAARFEGRGLDMDVILKRATGQRFFNTSKLDLTKVHSDAENVAAHLIEYLAGFDRDSRDIFDAFNFTETVAHLNKAGLLYRLLGRFLEVDVHPDTVPHAAMGDIFEELIRRFSEVSNETAGEHFTPREIVRLCAELVLAGDAEAVATPGIVRKVYDPACGTGGMLSVIEELVRDRNPKAKLLLFGQELNPESWAICCAEMLLKGQDQDPSRIASGSTLSDDGHEDERFDYMLANPPFGVDWSKDHAKVTQEQTAKGFDGRFGAGVPRKGDGALLFLQDMLAKMKPADQGGSRIAIIFNGSPLSTGELGSGESEIRRWVFERDWLETVVALPENIFYNTGLPTYIWVLTNVKQSRREGKVQLIDGRALWEPMRRSLGDKRRELSLENIETVLDLWARFDAEDPRSQVHDNAHFGYRQVKLERALRLIYRADADALTRLRGQAAFQKLTDPTAQDALVDAVASMDGYESADADHAVAQVTAALGGAAPKAPVKKALLAAMSVRDPLAPVVRRKDGSPEPDPELRDIEVVPLATDPAEHFESQVVPYADDAWMGDVDPRVGYELPMTRLFFRRRGFRPLELIEDEIADVASQLETLRGELHTQRAAALADALADRPRNARLGFVGRWLSGGTPSRDDADSWAGEMPWASSKDLHVEHLSDTIEHITETAAATGSRLIPAGTLLIATRGMSLAKRLPMALTTREMAFNQDLKAIIPAPGVDAEYLRLILRALEPEVLALAAEAAHGTKRLETPLLKAFRIPLPDIDEQQRVVAPMLDVERTLLALDGLLAREHRLLAEHRYALIAAGVAGIKPVGAETLVGG